MNLNYLSEEEQYKKILNNEEIKRIENKELREIRQKFWLMRHKADEDTNIPDEEIGKAFQQICVKEMQEIEEYKLRKKNHN